MARGGYLVIDIETVPDRSLYTPPETPFGEEKPFPPIYAHQPVAIGALWLGADLSFRRLGILGESLDEAAQLQAFSGFIARDRPTLVTWNGRSFDLPVLMLRALRHGVPMAWYYRRFEVRYRYSDEGHLDLADALSDRGAARMTSLDHAARLIGMPGKMGVDGSQVDGLYRAGRHAEIRHYCLTDVIQTAFVLLRYFLLTGLHSRPVVLGAVAGLLAALEEDGRFGELLEQVDRPLLLLRDLPPGADAEDAAGSGAPDATGPAGGSGEASLPNEASSAHDDAETQTAAPPEERSVPAELEEDAPDVSETPPEHPPSP